MKLADLKVRVVAPCSESEIRENFRRFVESAGEVNSSTLADLIERAYRLTIVEADSSLRASAALKRPYCSYQNDVFSKAGASGQGEVYCYELGWIHVAESLRGNGIGKKLVGELLEGCEGDRVFATVRTNNDSMTRILTSFDFDKIGSPYPSQETTGAEIQLFGWQNA